MKNKVCRLVISAILSIAMILTMAACGDKPTPSPSPTVSPTTPTTSPSPTTTVTPKPVEDDVAKKFGITVTNLDSTYKFQNISTILGAYEEMQYIVIEYDAKKLQNYSFKFEVTGVEYEGENKFVRNSFVLTDLGLMEASTAGSEKKIDAAASYNTGFYLPYEFSDQIGNASPALPRIFKQADGSWRSDLDLLHFNAGADAKLSSTATDTIYAVDGTTSGTALYALDATGVLGYEATATQAVGIPVSKAGDYTFTVLVTITDNGFDFGRIGTPKEEVQQCEIVATAKIAKAGAYAMVASDVHKVDGAQFKTNPAYVRSIESYKAQGFTGATNTFNIPTGDAIKDINEINTYIYANGALSYLASYEWNNKYLDSTNHKVNAWIVEGNRYATYEEGSVPLNMIISSESTDVATTANFVEAAAPYLTSKKLEYGKDEALVDLEELSAPNFTFTIMPATKYYISEQDWNEIGDVITSGLEIPYKKYQAASSPAAEADNPAGPFGTEEFITQFKLAQSRYGALSDAQKAFFERYHDIETKETWAEETGYGEYYFANVADSSLGGLKYLGTNGWSASNANMAALPATDMYFTFAQTLTMNKFTSAGFMVWLTITLPAGAAAAQVEKDFNKFCADAGWTTEGHAAKEHFELTDLREFNAHYVELFNKVDAYVNGLSASERAAISVLIGTGPAVDSAIGTPADGTTTNQYKNVNYHNYAWAKQYIADANAKHVQSLIIGTLGAYNRAIEKITFGTSVNAIFSFAATATISATEYAAAGKNVVHFINDNEVKNLASQARAAYDKLDSAQKATIKSVKWTIGTWPTVTADPSTATLPTDLTLTYIGSKVLNLVSVLEAIETMNAVADPLSDLIKYVNVEQYAHEASKSPLYRNLSSLLYNTDINNAKAAYAATDANLLNNKIYDVYASSDGTIANTTSDYKDTYTFGAYDIIRAYNVAPDRYMDLVLTEYKALADLLKKYETYKADAVKSLEAMIKAEFVKDNDYTEGDIDAALDANNATLVFLKNVLTNEIVAIATHSASADSTDPYIWLWDMTADPADASGNAIWTDAKIVKNVIVNSLHMVDTDDNAQLAGKVKIESVSDLEEAFESLLDVEKAFEFFVKNYKADPAIKVKSDLYVAP